MKYTLEIDIALPRDQVVEKFAQPENWTKWQESLVSFEHLDGVPGASGAKTKLSHRFGGRNIEMVETVESNNLPDDMTCVYEAPGAWNRVVYRFEEAGPNRTRWFFDTEFRCGGVLRIMAFLMPGMFRRASQKDLNNFKNFAESETELT